MWLIVPVGLPSSCGRACVFVKVLLLFRITWLVRKRFPVFLFFLADSLPSLKRQATLSIKFKSVQREKNNAAVGKLKKDLCDLELGLQLCMHTADNTFFAGWYFIQSRQHIAETFGMRTYCSRYLLSGSVIIYYYYILLSSSTSLVLYVLWMQRKSIWLWLFQYYWP